MKLDTNALFTQYLNVVNRALSENRDRAPYRELLDLDWLKSRVGIS